MCFFFWIVIIGPDINRLTVFYLYGFPYIGFANFYTSTLQENDFLCVNVNAARRGFWNFHGLSVKVCLR